VDYGRGCAVCRGRDDGDAYPGVPIEVAYVQHLGGQRFIYKAFDWFNGRCREVIAHEAT
jgi:hypothetical protein